MKIRQEDIEWIRENIPARDVAEYLGMDIRRNSVLCPNPQHNDRHFGNCNFRRDGSLRCYACNKSFSSIDLMMYVGGMKFAEAVQQLASMSGYMLRTEELEKKEWFPEITKQEAELLEIPISYKRVKLPAEISDSRIEGFEEVIGMQSTEYIRYQEAPSPWLLLKQEDPVGYKWMVEQRVAFAIRRMAEIYNSAKKTGNKEMEAEALRRYQIYKKIKIRFLSFHPEKAPA